MKIKDIIFWLIIAFIIGIALWLLSGSPPEINAIISITLAVAASELILWKELFKTDSKTTMGFIKVKHEIDNFRKEINQRLDNIENLIKKTK